VGDIARRAVILNERDGIDAPALAFGVVLIDEVDLHLHPQWQRQVMGDLRRAFPNLQWIVTTHSPQVLSSVENRQVRRLVNRRLDPHPALIEGRDSDAILRDAMGTPDRDPTGQAALNDLLAAIEQGRLSEASQKLNDLRQRWGDLDPALVYADKLLEWERRDAAEE
jgi:predicted ATP-binding protein involved in virulence